MPASARREKRAERIDLRTTRKVKERIQQAARQLGTSVSSFIILHAYEAAQRTLWQDDVVTLSDRERDRFLALLRKAPKPTPALRRLLGGRKRGRK